MQRVETAILDEGGWQAYSCLERGGLIYLQAVVLITSFLALLALRDCFRRAPLYTTITKGQSVPLTILLIASILVLSTVFAIKRNRDVLRLEGGELVETGCHKLTRFEERTPVAGLRIAFRQLEQRRGDPSNWLQLKALPLGRTLWIDLEKSDHLRELARFAPDTFRLMVEAYRKKPWHLSAEQRVVIDAFDDR